MVGRGTALLVVLVAVGCPTDALPVLSKPKPKSAEELAEETDVLAGETTVRRLVVEVLRVPLGAGAVSDWLGVCIGVLDSE